MKFVTAIFVFLFLQVFTSQSQTKSGEITEGREFWFGFPHVSKYMTESARGLPVQVWIGSKINGYATIRIPSAGWQRTVKVQPGVVTRASLPEGVITNNSEIIEQWGVQITSTVPVNVTAYVSYSISGEAFSVIPVEALGKKYFTLNLYQDQVGQLYKPAEFLIVATKNNTTVTFIPKAHTESGVLEGQAKTIKLQQGETYLVKARIQPEYNQDWITDLSGSYIESDKPIAVISGHTKGSFPRFSSTMLGSAAHFMRNALMDMMMPVESLSTEYITAPIKYLNRTPVAGEIDAAGDLIRFVATQDNTLIYEMRPDGSEEMKISQVMKKGESFLLTNRTTAGFFRATKPVLCGQYGKAWRNQLTPPIIDGKGNEVSNPPRNGEGMLICLTPRQRWSSFTTFYAPTGMDNFVMIQFETENAQTITFDGLSLMGKFSSSIKKVEGTSYSYIVAQISAGDHTINGMQSDGSENQKFAAYVYGNLDRTKDGFAYGYPTGVNYTVACPDSLKLTAKQLCGTVTGDVSIAPLNSPCGDIYSISLVDSASYNYELTLNDRFQSGEYTKEANFKLTIQDLTKPAFAQLHVLLRSGRAFDTTFSYEPENVMVQPDKIDYGSVAIDQEITRDFTISNNSKVATEVKSLSFKNGVGDFSIKSVTPALPITIQPNESIVVTVALTKKNHRSIVDTVQVEFGCFIKPIVEVKASGSTPVIYVDNADFGEVPVGMEEKREVGVMNQGTIPLEVTKIEWADSLHFIRVENFPLPMTLEPRKTHFFTAVYKPDVPNVTHSTQAILTNSAGTHVKNYSNWTGRGVRTDVDIIGYDWKQRRVLDSFAGVTEYKGMVSIRNVSSPKKDLTFLSLTLDSGDVASTDAIYFTLDDSQIPSMIFNDVQVPVTFLPREERDYKARIRLVVKQITGSIDTLYDYLLGTGIQPHVSAESYDFGSIEMGKTSATVSQPVRSFVPLGPQGTMPLTLFEAPSIIGPDARSFVIDPAFLSSFQTPTNLQLGDSLMIPVWFTPSRPGVHNAMMIIKEDGVENVAPTLIGMGLSSGLSSTDADFGTPCVNVHVDKSISITALSDGNLVDIQLTGANPSFFQLNYGSLPIPLSANVPTIIPVTYAAPMTVGSFSADVVMKTDNAGTVTSKLTANAKMVKATAQVQDTRNVKIGDSFTVPIELKDVSPDFLEANVTTIKLILRRTTNAVTFLSGIENIITKGTLLENWQIVKALPIGDNDLEIEARSNGTPMLDRSGTLLLFSLKSLLDETTSTTIELEIISVGSPCAIIDPLPGIVTIEPGCAYIIRNIHNELTVSSLSELVPNPTTGTATIAWTVGYSAQTKIELLDANGQVVNTILNTPLKEGAYELQFDSSELNSGVYFCRMQSGSTVVVQKISVVK